jgi:hypothetical protein
MMEFKPVHFFIVILLLISVYGITTVNARKDAEALNEVEDFFSLIEADSELAIKINGELCKESSLIFSQMQSLGKYEPSHYGGRNPFYVEFIIDSESITLMFIRTTKEPNVYKVSSPTLYGERPEKTRVGMVTVEAFSRLLPSKFSMGTHD